MQQFDITLKNEKVKQYDRIALFFIIINLALFIYLAVSFDIKSVKGTTGAAVLIILALVIDYFLTSIKNNEGSPYKMGAEFIITMTWFQLDYWWVAVLCFLLSFLHQASKRPLLVNVLREKIIYPSFPRKTIQWTDLNNIILKDGLLTINFKNERFIQQFIDETVTALNEQEFNDFCRQQLNT